MATREIRIRQQQQRRVPIPVPVPATADDDSDVEEPQLGLRKSDGRDSQIIHSGHFMVSTPHIEHPPKKGYDFDTVNKQTCQTYHFGKASMSHLSIDASLTKLFECMTLAYSGRLVSPKWKNFKGLKLLWRDKIRLNNAIWRAWYMQYVEKRENPVCHFVTPLDGTMDSGVHRPTEAIATEGKYWKRRIEIVLREYHKWRTYFKKRLQKHKDDDLSSLLKGAEEQLSLFGEVHPDTFRLPFWQDEDAVAAATAGVWAGVGGARKSRDSPVPMEMDPIFDMDVLMSEFSDTLFSTLASHQPVAWPNPREIAHAGNADMIQPGLIPLQPNLDFMDTFEPLQDLFHTLRQPLYPPSCPPAPSSSSSSSSTPLPSTTCTSTSSSSSSSATTTNTPAQTPLLPSMHLPPDLPLAPPPPPVPAPSTDCSAYQPHYIPLFPDQSPVVAPPPALLQHSPAPCPVSVVTHTAPSTPVTPSAAAAATSGRGSVLPLTTAPPPQARAPPPQQPQNFALPRPILPSGGAKKSRHPPMVPIAPSPHLILTAGPAGALIVTPSPLKTDVVPASGMVISSASVPRLLPAQSQKPPQLIVPKEESAGSAPSTKSPAPCCTGDGGSSGQGSPCGSEQVPSPQSPLGSGSGSTKSESSQGRRVSHISAEQKRRFNINIGFKTLCGLVPTLKAQPTQSSNALTLQRTVEYVVKLQQERAQLQEESRRLRDQIEQLNTSISVCQEQLPATGVPITRHRFDHMKEKFDEYVRSRTLQDWKFWIFSIIIRPLFESFNSSVSTSSRTELCDSTMQWLERDCALPVLRPMVLGTLRQLSTSTSILSDPALLPEESRQAVTCPKSTPGHS